MVVIRIGLALAEQYGLKDLTRVQLDSPPAERQQFYDVVLAQLKDIIVPGIDDPFVALRAKGLARIVKYLGAADRSSAGLAQSVWTSRQRTATGSVVAPRQ
jgi:hypothetical protein